MKRYIFTVILLLTMFRISEAWTSRTYQTVVVKSVKLMPASFRKIMLRYKEEILTGCLQPDTAGEAAHVYMIHSRSGFLQDRVLELTAQIPQKIRNHKHFAEIAVDFGRLAHYMSDLNDPLLLADGDSREPQYRTDFAVYLEKQMELFPWVFDGHLDPLLEKDEITGYLYEIASAAAQKYPKIGEAYFPKGTLVSSNTFDAKSLPFGIASLSYSKSITHTIQIWFYIWRKAHGDITYTPYFSKQHKN